MSEIAWSAPRTWVTAELVTAAIGNAHWRDNLLETAPAKVTTKGDVVAATGANAIVRVAAGADNTVLAAASGQAAGVAFTDISTVLAASGVLADLSDVTVTTPADGQVLTYESGAGIWQNEAIPEGTTLKRKTANESVVNSTTLQDDDHLFIAMAANEVWVWECVLIVSSVAADDIKIAFTAPGGASIEWAAVNGIDTGFDPSDTTADAVSTRTTSTSRSYGTTGFNHLLVLRGHVANGATSGNLQLQWAQNSASATGSTVVSGSHLVGHKFS